MFAFSKIQRMKKPIEVRHLQKLKTAQHGALHPAQEISNVNKTFLPSITIWDNFLNKNWDYENNETGIGFHFFEEKNERERQNIRQNIFQWQQEKRIDNK